MCLDCKIDITKYDDRDKNREITTVLTLHQFTAIATILTWVTLTFKMLKTNSKKDD